MSVRIEVGYKDAEYDAAGHRLLRDIRDDLGITRCRGVRVVDVYQIDGRLSPAQVRRVARELLTDPVVQECGIGRALPGKYQWAVEVGLNHGVTDNVAATAMEGIADLLGRKFRGTLHTLRQYRLSGQLSAVQVATIRTRLLSEMADRYNRELYEAAKIAIKIK